MVEKNNFSLLFSRSPEAVPLLGLSFSSLYSGLRWLGGNRMRDIAQFRISQPNEEVRIESQGMA